MGVKAMFQQLTLAGPFLPRVAAMPGQSQGPGRKAGFRDTISQAQMGMVDVIRRGY